MKPPPFGYARPDSVAGALSELQSAGQDAKILAGGQSLVPLLNLRLAAPSCVIDINKLAELDYVRVTGGSVVTGALARHARVLRDPAVAAAQPLLHQALRHVAHAAIRNRGTVVGSLVHADPAAEMPAVLALLGGSVRLASTAGHRSVPAADFFLGPLESDVQPDELALEAEFPALPAAAGTGFAEISRRRGDFAMCGVAARVQLDPGGRISAASAAYLAVGPRPLVLDLTPACAGIDPGQAADFGPAAREAMAAVRPESDIHAIADYRRHLAGVLTIRALREALASARSAADD